MKYKLTKEFTDLAKADNIGYFKVNPDKEIYFGKKEQFPIVWTGVLNENMVKIELKNSDSFSIRNYEFIVYPKSENSLKEQIVKWIDEYINGEYGN